MSLPIELQIHKVCGARPAVRDKITHQGIDDIRVDFHSYRNYSYSIRVQHLRLGPLISSRGAGIVLLMIKRIKFLGIPVRDQDRALRFYTEKLGFRILTDQEFSDKQRWIELSIPGAETGISLFTPDGQEDRIGTFINTSWEVDNIDKTYAELLSRGVEFLGPPQKQSWGTYAILKDSEGNQIVLGTR